MPENPSGNPAGNPDDPKKISILGKIPIEYDPVALNNISKAIHEQTNVHEKANNASGGVSEIGIKEQKKANAIAKLAALVSGLGLAATLVVIILNYKAINAANRSTNIADNTLKETKMEFKVLNEPYLEITEPRLVFTDSISEMTVYYQLENLKSVPAQIIYKAQQCDLDTSNNPNIDSLFNLAESKKDTTYLGNGKNAYLTNDSKWPPFFVRFNPKTSPLTREGYEVLKSTHIFWIYICDVIRYRDALTNTERVYKGIVRVKNIAANNRFYAEYLYNKNEDY
jgi:hypothetical protein